MISDFGSAGGVLAYVGALMIIGVAPGCGDDERTRALSVPEDAGSGLDGSHAADGSAATSGSGGRPSGDARAARDPSTSADGSGAQAGDTSDAADGGGSIATCPSLPPRPAGPGVCGDGWRNPASEECDDGNTDDTDLCSAECRTLDRLIAPPAGAIENDPPPRHLAAGGHVIASGCDGFGVTHVEGDKSRSVAIAIFDRKGTARDGVTDLNEGSTLLPSADPVIAALPQGEFAVAWNDLGGDGHLLGIALKRVDPASPAGSGVTFANARRDFSQYDPDILRAGSELVVAWVDDSQLDSAPDLRVRRFDLSLSPLSAGDETLAGGPARESSVALASFGASWAAAWRSRNDSGEIIGAQAHGTYWEVTAMRPGPAGDRPAIVELDGARLFVVFAAERPTSTTYALKGAVLDIGRPGVTDSFDIASLAVADSTVSHSQPTVVRTGDRLYLSWRSTSALGSPHAEEVWLKEVPWSSDSTSVTLDLNRAELPLPRATAHRQGDQRTPRLVSTVYDSGGSIVGVWQDFGRVFGAGQAGPDVLVELIPAPVLRLPEERRLGK